MHRPCPPSPLSRGRVRSSSWLPVGVWLLTSACGPGVATPMPEPPAAAFDLSGVGKGALPATAPATSASYITAAPGTVPAGSTVRITNLDQTTVVFAVTAAPDGSFLAVAVASAGEELRFEWTKDGQHSEPADGVVLAAEPLAQTIQVQAAPRFDCLKLAPGYALDFSTLASQTLQLQNDCDEAISLQNPRARLSLPDFSLETALPPELAAGEAAELGFTFTREADGLREDVWFVDATQGGQTIRYPITLRAE